MRIFAPGQLSEEHGWQNCSARGSFIVSGKLQYKKQQIEGVWEGTENGLKLMDCVTDFHEYLKQRDHRECDDMQQVEPRPCSLSQWKKQRDNSDRTAIVPN